MVCITIFCSWLQYYLKLNLVLNLIEKQEMLSLVFIGQVQQTQFTPGGGIVCVYRSRCWFSQQKPTPGDLQCFALLSLRQSLALILDLLKFNVCRIKVRIFLNSMCGELTGEGRGYLTCISNCSEIQNIANKRHFFFAQEMSDLLFATFVIVLIKLAPIGHNRICSHTKAHLPLLQLHL